MEKAEELKELKDKAQVRLALWLGLEEDQRNWDECCSSGELSVLAETVSCMIMPQNIAIIADCIIL